jgi:hypothetical protein
MKSRTLSHPPRTWFRDADHTVKVMSEVNMAITELEVVWWGVNSRIEVVTYPPLSATRTGETATERNIRSIEPRATAAHSLKEFQPAYAHYNLIITLGIDGPILQRKVADVNDGSEPSKISSSNFRRRRRVKVHAEVWSL